ncbi:MAG: hypothetical protein V1873_03810 [Verrucomicrobiota bacterium]
MKSVSVRRVVAASLTAFLGLMPAQASWIQFSLPSLSQAFGGTALAHLPDGRYVFAETGNLYLQDLWNAAAYTPFQNEPVGIDPSFMTVWNSATAAIGHGGWGSSPVSQFDPSAPADAGFTNIGVTLQNFHGVFRDANGLFVGGADTGSGGDRHGIRWISLSGGTNRIVIDDVSVYSTGFTADESGNLYVGDNDDGKVYRFTKAQLDTAIESSPLSITDGELIYDFGEGGDIGSLAVDAGGRIWAAGWQHNGLRVYNPALAEEFMYVPNLDNANYKVAVFGHDGTNYIAYMNQADPFNGGTAQYYGFAPAGEFAIPEPAPFVLVMLGLSGWWVRRRAMGA